MGNEEVGHRRSWTVRLGVWCARHAAAVSILWLVATVGVFVFSLAIGGTRTANSTGGSARTEATRAAAAAQGDVAASEYLNVVIGGGANALDEPSFRAAVAAALDALVSARVESEGRSVPAVAGLADPFAAPIEAGLVSSDATSVRLAGRIDGNDAERGAKAKAVSAVLEAARLRYPNVEIHAVSDSLLLDQMSEEIARDLDASLLISLPATFLILVLAFGAIVAAGMPLLLAITALLAAFGLVGIFSQTVEPVSPYAGQFIVLIGLAVAVDYSLFVITRYRAERRRGRDKMASIEAATATSGRAVLFSGFAVMISLAALFLLPDALFQSMAIGTIAVLAMSVAGSLVFLPALLAVTGDWLDRGRIPFVAGRLPDSRALWARAASVVMRHPVAATLATVTLLLVVASPLSRLRLGETDITGFPQRMDSVQAVQALEDHWPQGALLRLQIVATHAEDPAVAAASDHLEPALLAIPGLSGPAQTTTTPDGRVRSVSLLMSGDQNDPANWEIVRRVRADVVPRVFGDAASGVLVGGGAAASLDQTQVYTDGIVRIFVFVLGLSFILLLVVFRSIAIPLKAIVLNLLATGSAFGAMVLVFQEGWLGGLLGIERADAIQNFVPVFVFTTLFGLSMDYEVFILSRVRENVDAGMATRDAVASAIAATAGTVTSAAAIMVVVFGIFLTLPLPIARELGLGLMVAVFVDATIIRTVLLPATMRLLGEWNWWLPRMLEWLPRVSIEANTDSEPTPVPANPATRLLPSGTTGVIQ